MDVPAKSTSAWSKANRAFKSCERLICQVDQQTESNEKIAELNASEAKLKQQLAESGAACEAQKKCSLARLDKAIRDAESHYEDLLKQERANGQRKLQPFRCQLRPRKKIMRRTSPLKSITGVRRSVP